MWKVLLAVMVLMMAMPQKGYSQCASCGNNTVEGSETCDDGNTVDESDAGVPTSPPDTCPKNCMIGSCGPGTTTPQTVSVNFTVPAGTQVAGVTVFVDYPDTKCLIPGSGSSSGVTSSITNLPSGALSQPNDLDYGLLEAVLRGTAISPGLLFRLTLQRCPGAPALVAGDFKCVVKGATNPQGQSVSGVTCSVSVP
jgi:hypothetical protein